jgi:Uma2 family endonuclease
MGTKVAMSVEEYLHTSFSDLDKEYRDGEVVERSMPDNLHSATQALLIAFFAALRKTLLLYPRPELRLKIRPGLIRIPDVSVFYQEPPTERYPSTPPFIAIEIVSLDDRMSDVRSKLEEYRSWGVPHVWLVDPHSRRLYTCDQGLHEVEILQVPELNLVVTSADVFEA